MIEHNIESQNFKTHVISNIVGMNGKLGLRQCRIPCDDGFDENVIDSLFQKLNIMALRFNVLIN